MRKDSGCKSSLRRARVRTPRPEKDEGFAIAKAQTLTFKTNGPQPEQSSKPKIGIRIKASSKMKKSPPNRSLRCPGEKRRPQKTDVKSAPKSKWRKKYLQCIVSLIYCLT